MRDSTQTITLNRDKFEYQLSRIHQAIALMLALQSAELEHCDLMTSLEGIYNLTQDSIINLEEMLKNSEADNA
ncbi:hypothetical protein E4T80_03150 [Muribacter muris]|uniref:Uncharacterized protein n=1 Tax=Muribacter muris TaxID=67855 RepID=A0A4Y9K5N9_9PAST|nr:hypothetical protein [Muribacter muris]MBF0784472.1 hypothetical protein [Muribacter muris]MBF0826232.1 hypothetical protein [Muribacter muris]TFV11986.1 hypothetical protein E4T80_03150 [Muribacter muris]